MNIYSPLNIIQIVILYLIGALISSSRVRNEHIPLILVILSICIKLISNLSVQYIDQLEHLNTLFYGSIIDGFFLACVPITIKQFGIQFRKIKIY